MKDLRFITDEQIKKAIEMHSNGYSWKIVAKRLGFTGQGLAKAVKHWEALNGKVTA